MFLSRASLLACCLIAPTLALNRVSFLFTFGDSYTSTGYDPYSLLQPSYLNPLGNPLWPGVTTAGGANWVDKLTYDHLPAGYTTFTYNYAYPGALVNHTNYPPGSYLTTTDFVSQVDTFKRVGPKISDGSRAAALLYWGTNDVLVEALQPDAQQDGPDLVSKVMDTYWALVDQLLASGVRNFVILTADTVERVPLATLQQTKTPGYVALCKSIRTEWNKQLKTRAAQFQTAKGSSVKMAIADLVPTFNLILDEPTRNGAPNNYCVDSSGNKCLWTDIIHPGQALHTAIAEKAAEALRSIGLFP